MTLYRQTAKTGSTPDLIHMAVTGNPDSGISSLFNRLTGGITHKGFFSDNPFPEKEGLVTFQRNMNAVQLPGIYSLSSLSKDTAGARRFFLQQRPDILVNTLSLSGLERGLSLTCELMTLELPMVLVLDCTHGSDGSSCALSRHLSLLLNLPVFPLNSGDKKSIEKLCRLLLKTLKHPESPRAFQAYSGSIYSDLQRISRLIESNCRKTGLPLQFCAQELLEGNSLIEQELELEPSQLTFLLHLHSSRPESQRDVIQELARMRYAFTKKICSKIRSLSPAGAYEEELSAKLDQVLTHPYFALPVFILIMLLIFYTTFNSAGEWFSSRLSLLLGYSIQKISCFLMQLGVSPAFHRLAVEGICTGIGSVLSFLPVIAMFFLFLSLLEESGYTPRVAFVTDKLLHKVGLSGHSVIPMLMGFGCSVPALLAACRLPKGRDRYLTVFLIPFLSCSAKLPVYAMFTAAFFARYRWLVIAALYGLGICTGLLCLMLLKKILPEEKELPFLLVLPPYRIPHLKDVGICIWENTKGFIKKAFTVILTASALIWFLQSFDVHFHMTAHAENSLLAFLGKALAPFFAPLGFGRWEAAAALITGFSAKETIVSTLAVLASAKAGLPLSAFLSELFTPLSALSFLVFCLLYTPCAAAAAALHRELRSWKKTIFLLSGQCAAAWICAFAVFRIGQFMMNI